MLFFFPFSESGGRRGRRPSSAVVAGVAERHDKNAPQALGLPGVPLRATTTRRRDPDHWGRPAQRAANHRSTYRTVSGRYPVSVQVPV